jgi:hypothetical protein
MRKLLKSIYRMLIPEPVPQCDLDTLKVLTSVLHSDSNAIDIGCNRGSILEALTKPQKPAEMFRQTGVLSGPVT